MVKAGKLKKVHLCHTNDFPADKNDKIKQWVENNGGAFSKTITQYVTHLVCSEKAFKKNITIVKEAKRVRGLKIVKFDWLEDTLQSKGSGCKPEGPYMWGRVVHNNRKKEVQKKQSKDERVDERLKAFDAGVKAFQQDMNASGYHPYTDHTGFTYYLVLVRSFLLTNRLESHHLKVGAPPSTPDSHSASPPPIMIQLNAPQLIILPTSLPHHKDLRVPIVNPLAQSIQLFESHDVPRKYCAYVKYTRSARHGINVLAPIGSDFELAFGAFKRFFKSKTGKVWEERLDGIKPPVKIGGDEEVEEWFRYQMPGGKQSKGVLPGELKTATATPTYAEVAAQPAPAVLVPKPRPAVQVEPMDVVKTQPEQGLGLLDMSNPGLSTTCPDTSILLRSSATNTASSSVSSTIASSQASTTAPSKHGTGTSTPATSIASPFADPRIKQKYPDPTHTAPHQHDPPTRILNPLVRSGFQHTIQPRTRGNGHSTTHPDIIDLTGDDEVDGLMSDLVRMAEATKGATGLAGEW